MSEALQAGTPVAAWARQEKADKGGDVVLY
jgi:hypothetical protein